MQFLEDDNIWSVANGAQNDSQKQLEWDVRKIDDYLENTPLYLDQLTGIS